MRIKANPCEVVDVTMQVTCLPEDADLVKTAFKNWWMGATVPLIQRPRTGGIKVRRRPMRPWMRPAFAVLREEDR